MRTNRTNQVKRPQQKIGFGVSDAKGREIGCIVVSGEFDFVETTDTCAYNIEAGHYYYAAVQAARNGEGYGASQSLNYFKTPDEQSNYIDGRVAASRKAAQKKSAK
jgi:hypothetical protein